MRLSMYSPDHWPGRYMSIYNVAGMDTSYGGQNISPQGRLMNCRGDINHGYYLQTSTSLQFYPFLADKGDGSRFPSIRN